MDRAAPVELFYPESADPGSSGRLYGRIIEWIGAAESEVWVLGDGFSCADADGVALAERYIAAYHRALERGARIVRVEDVSSGSAHWHQLLQNTLERFPGSFELHFIQDQKAVILARCLAVDPDSSRCRAMVGLRETDALGNTPDSGSGVFTSILPAGLTLLSSGDSRLAGFIRVSIRALVDGGETARGDSADFDY